jgi:ASC-1-like (ASCH) protein
MNSQNSSVLRLTLHREFFSQIAEGTKRVEYREQKPYWKSRLENKTYDTILFRNGYAANAPEMLVQFRGLRRQGKGPNAKYAILLGKILSIKRWKP